MSASFSALDLAGLAAGQWGLFTTAQARTVGVSPQQLARLAERGIVERLRHGAYRISGAPISREEQLRAAWLMIEPAATADDQLNQQQPAVVSHRSAAKLHGLGDADADVMEFIVARRKQSRLTDVRYRVAALAPERWTLIDGLPVTTVLSTVEDLAADHLDGGHLAGIVRDAVITCRLDPDDAAAALRPYAHTYGAPLGDGSGLLDRFLAEAGVPESTRRLSQRLTVNRDAAIAAAHDALAEAMRRSRGINA
ncbi:type IV toxin-antitoxin system AbiEi family antitoxin domain-containing protein [Tomitella biformata]|uniref:type IV toxin-antitoxin system AbiEi family antitoxin domain-containing protein n=1 Tax=Tomitella biformata TaxID=630403 RepID=UPI000463D6E9|nr:type IV toxin-antitoxin system AbiEi family antitoxin domain-containing protein [Tomitella biformata]